ncbi:hypothetical protein K1719_011055 [Acacia pycnantha]|nr:hypothetical protein K1719_011055 [Acacia pycnantha]
MQDGREVAVKLLSQNSRQGYKEFHSELDLLTFVHHKRLLSFVVIVRFVYEGPCKRLLESLVVKHTLTGLMPLL